MDKDVDCNVIYSRPELETNGEQHRLSHAWLLP